MNDSDARDRSNLDETIEESFPASDPPANTVETGIRLQTESVDSPVVDNPALSRFELVRDGELAFLLYERRKDAFVLVHTEVPPALRGRHLGDRLAEAGLAAARASGLKVVVVCPFVRAYMKRHGLASH